MLCDGLDDTELAALITELKAAKRETMFGGGVAEVGGEGRKMVMTVADRKQIERELAAALRERDRRAGNGAAFGAMGVDF